MKVTGLRGLFRTDSPHRFRQAAKTQKRPMFAGSKPGYLSASCPLQQPLVVSGVVKCRQQVSRAVMEIAAGGDRYFVPADCPARTESGLDYSYSAAHLPPKTEQALTVTMFAT